jgi:hypothetical protein
MLALASAAAASGHVVSREEAGICDTYADNAPVLPAALHNCKRLKRTRNQFSVCTNQLHQLLVGVGVMAQMPYL